VAAVPESIAPPENDKPTAATSVAEPLKATDVVDLLLAGNPDKPTEPISTAVAVADIHPLTDVSDVEAAAVVIGKMLVADRDAKGIRVYPRRILRQQHIAAYMLVNPFATTTEICAFFGIGPGALSNICKSDTFKALITAHKISVETSIGADLQEQLKQTLQVSLDVVQKSVTSLQDPDYALQVLDKTANRLGMGAKHNTNVQINNNVVTPEMIAAARARRVGTVIQSAPTANPGISGPAGND